MRNLTICLVAFAVAFAMCGVAFRTVVSAQGKRQEAASAFDASATMAPAHGGVPATYDADLY
jgi:Mn2+/Fe2+ NRAMP family transporter